MKKGVIKFNNGWCFAIVNGRLAEIYFDKNYGIFGHRYVERRDYSKREQRMVDSDIKRHQFIYCKGYYIDKNRGGKQKVLVLSKIFPEIQRIKKLHPVK